MQNIKIVNRPPCLECGTENPLSVGINWRCRNPKCNRQWLKNPRISNRRR